MDSSDDTGPVFYFLLSVILSVILSVVILFDCSQ